MNGYRGYLAPPGSLARRQPQPRRGDVLRALPPGSRRLQSRQAVLWVELGLQSLPGFQRLRSDAQDNVLAFARLLAARMSWADGTTWHSRQARCDQAGLSPSTWKSVRRLLRQWGCLGTVYEGCLRFDGQVTRCDAAVYVLCLPRAALRKIAALRKLSRSRPVSRPPTVEPEVGLYRPIAARQNRTERRGPPSGPACSLGGPRNAELAAGSQAARAMAGVIRAAAGQGRPITDGWVGYWVRRFTAAGWSPDDVREAIAGPPAGQLHRYLPAKVRRPAGVLWWFFSQWTGPDGVLKPSPSKMREAAARAAREQNQPLSAAARKSPPADAEAHAARIRAQMGWPDPNPNPRRPA